nr:arsenite efflux MFS transporter ArsK [uncultured Gellertiella sp.]
MSRHFLPEPSLMALGLSQIIGYGTLYYAFSLLSPSIAAAFGWRQEWLFGALSVTLVLSAGLSPLSGRLADRLGAARLMVPGSVASGLFLLLAGLSPNGATYLAALLGMQFASAFVLYSTAFAAIVQAGGPGARNGITHLTMIAGFASTLFWPFTAFLLHHMDWRAIHLLFGGLNLLVALPIHVWLYRRARKGRQQSTATPAPHTGPLPDETLPAPAFLFPLMVAAFAAEGFLLSSVLVHMVPLTAAVGLGAAAPYIATLFGPAQVVARFVNMVFGRNLSQAVLALAAAFLLPAGVTLLVLTAPGLYGAIAFALVFGMGSGVASITSGTLPLELFGRQGYATRLGVATGVRLFCSALAPFALSALEARLGTIPALWWMIAVGGLGTLMFLAIAMRGFATARR